MKHSILQLPELPRDRAKLQTIINEARAAQRRARLQIYGAILAALVAFVLLFFVVLPRMSSAAPATPGQPAATIQAAESLQQSVFIPIAIR